MCGITGYTGFNQAGPILLEGLRRLEYRGYDSAGIAVQSMNDDTEEGSSACSIKMLKAIGKVSHLADKFEAESDFKGVCGIGRRQDHPLAARY